MFKYHKEKMKVITGIESIYYNEIKKQKSTFLSKEIFFEYLTKVLFS